jgi:hypothetical protein
MYIYILYVYTYINIYTYRYMYLYIYKYINKYINMYVYMSIYEYICWCLCIFHIYIWYVYVFYREVGNKATVLGFVGLPYTLATYMVEGGSSKEFKEIKSLSYQNPKVLHAMLSKLADNIGEIYVFMYIRIDI